MVDWILSESVKPEVYCVFFFRQKGIEGWILSQSASYSFLSDKNRRLEARWVKCGVSCFIIVSLGQKIKIKGIEAWVWSQLVNLLFLSDQNRRLEAWGAESGVPADQVTWGRQSLTEVWGECSTSGLDMSVGQVHTYTLLSTRVRLFVCLSAEYKKL